jgi:hypothetical protein|uniref:Reverse transcriptase zinc-binding domain-containing protein n=1 Tax=Zea mays TaxID=4577 RepID=B4FYI8_MAIZE|nr:unknown [Zea mays]
MEVCCFRFLFYRFSSSAYSALFPGTIEFEPAERVWKSWAPRKCKFFIWVVEHDRCWTADRLAKRGLDHPERYLLCDQAVESINRLLVGCVFAKQFWLELVKIGCWQGLCPQQDDHSFETWWMGSSSRVIETARKDFNSFVILGAWIIWKHRNRCVFHGCSLSLVVALRAAREEAVLWSLTEIKALSSLRIDELLFYLW